MQIFDVAERIKAAVEIIFEFVQSLLKFREFHEDEVQCFADRLAVFLTKLYPANELRSVKNGEVHQHDGDDGREAVIEVRAFFSEVDDRLGCVENRAADDVFLTGDLHFDDEIPAKVVFAKEIEDRGAVFGRIAFAFFVAGIRESTRAGQLNSRGVRG